jgi:hypothetical protein
VKSHSINRFFIYSSDHHVFGFRATFALHGGAWRVLGTSEL